MEPSHGRLDNRSRLADKGDARAGAGPYAADVEVAVLGPVEVTLNGTPVDLGTPKQRALVSALALSRGWPVSVDAIVDLLWEEHAPPGVTATLQAYVSQLRRVLEPERQRRAPATVLVTVAPGYALRVPERRGGRPPVRAGRDAPSTAGCSRSPGADRPRCRPPS